MTKAEIIRDVVRSGDPSRLSLRHVHMAILQVSNRHVPPPGFVSRIHEFNDNIEFYWSERHDCFVAIEWWPGRERGSVVMTCRYDDGLAMPLDGRIVEELRARQTSNIVDWAKRLFDVAEMAREQQRETEQQAQLAKEEQDDYFAMRSVDGNPIRSPGSDAVAP